MFLQENVQFAQICINTKFDHDLQESWAIAQLSHKAMVQLSLRQPLKNLQVYLKTGKLDLHQNVPQLKTVT